MTALERLLCTYISHIVTTETQPRYKSESSQLVESPLSMLTQPKERIVAFLAINTKIAQQQMPTLWPPISPGRGWLDSLPQKHKSHFVSVTHSLARTKTGSSCFHFVLRKCPDCHHLGSVLSCYFYRLQLFPVLFMLYFYFSLQSNTQNVP